MLSALVYANYLLTDGPIPVQLPISWMRTQVALPPQLQPIVRFEEYTPL